MQIRSCTPPISSTLALLLLSAILLTVFVSGCGESVEPTAAVQATVTPAETPTPPGESTDKPQLPSPTPTEVPQSTPCCESALFTDVPDQGIATPSDNPTVVRTRYVRINFHLLPEVDASPDLGTNAVSQVVLNLFEDAVFTAVLDRFSHNDSGSLTWFGRIAGENESRLTLVIRDEVMIGDIWVGSALYQIQYSGDGVHIITQVDQSAFPQEAEPATRSPP